MPPLMLFMRGYHRDLTNRQFFIDKLIIVNDYIICQC